MNEEKESVVESASMGPKRAGAWKSWLRQVVGIAISIVCLVLVFRRVDVEALKSALVQMRWHFLAMGLLSLAIDYSVRIERWAVMLRAAGSQVRTRQCISPFLGSITLNNVLPLRAGDLVRALVFPAAIGVTRVTATASLVFERLIDLLTLLLALGLGLVFSPMRLPEWVGTTVLAIAICGTVALIVVVFWNRLIVSLLGYLGRRFSNTRLQFVEKLLAVAASLVEQLGMMGKARTLGRVLLLSAIVWAGEAGLFWSIFQGLDIPAGYSSALTVMAVATLSTLVPSSPGYVGPFHLAAFAAVRALGGTEGQAATFAVLAHLSLWLPTTIAGGIAILANPKLFSAGSRK
ncbi:flippase-like domain-containing protein [Paraburkholderia edwinii]|uniref:Flippase-like domain-containing protein n=1 Tax=Paraburkholderia edwinii TaxID=2861782 RepID=A0ABX8UG48_9BURK|nr:lysylphosphatidylglycerol synthase transmembrane domain-containing protein [Paraburkholderia edwinii]QYD67858.1 flippase-like domain-containing protein [Paraburkholderia edwinii]